MKNLCCLPLVLISCVPGTNRATERSLLGKSHGDSKMSANSTFDSSRLKPYEEAELCRLRAIPKAQRTQIEQQTYLNLAFRESIHEGKAY